MNSSRRVFSSCDESLEGHAARVELEVDVVDLDRATEGERALALDHGRRDPRERRTEGECEGEENEEEEGAAAHK